MKSEISEIFTKIELEKYADVLIWGMKKSRKEMGGAYKKGDVILIPYQLDSLRLAEVIHRKVVKMGMLPVMRMGSTPQMELDYYTFANEEQLKILLPWSEKMYQNLHGLIALRAPASLTHLANVDPKKMAIAAVANKPLLDIRKKREEEGEFGWTLCMMPTPALAEQAKMSLQAYADEIKKACYLDKDNPTKYWENLYEKSADIKKWLKNLEIQTLRIESASIDLKITVGEKKRWLGVSGQNIPSFEIFTSPDWRGTEGIYFANMPTFRNGNYVEKVRLEFKKGRVVSVKAEKGEEFTKKQIEMDEGAGQLGEVSFTDKRFSPITKFMANTLFDENVGGEQGNCHIAVGMGFADTYDGDPKELTKEKKAEIGLNDSAMHWDLINTERKRVTAYLRQGASKVIYEDGMFKN